MDFKMLYPKLIPECRLIDLPESNHPPIQMFSSCISDTASDGSSCHKPNDSLVLSSHISYITFPTKGLCGQGSLSGPPYQPPRNGMHSSLAASRGGLCKGSW